MKYKMLVTDMDETLLNSDGRISKKNKEAIHNLIEAGGKVALASGRVQNAMYSHIKEIGVESQRHLSNNGVTLFDINGYNKTLHHLEQNEIYRILDALKNRGIESNIYLKDRVIHNDSHNLMNIMARFNADFPVIVGDPYKEENGFLIYGLISDKESMEFMLSLKSEKTNAFLGSGFVIFAPIKSGKFNGATHLAKDFKIKDSEIVCVGDGGNDIEMISASSMGVAVKNAIPEVKEVANIVLDKTNDEDAISYIINKYFLNI